jgi:hypothetical protein
VQVAAAKDPATRAALIAPIVLLRMAQTDPIGPLDSEPRPIPAT